MKRSNFQILDEMAARNMDISLAPLTNIIEANSMGKKGIIKIGVSPDMILRLAKEDFFGGLIFANKKQFEEVGNEPIETGKISDGYHTFDELYDHRITLFITLCAFIANGAIKRGSWRSKVQSDGKSIDGWFLLGLGKEKGEQITYHVPISRWEETDFAETLDIAPEFDGHTSADVLDRLKRL